MKSIESVMTRDSYELGNVAVGTVRGLLADLENGLWNETEGMRLLLLLSRDARPAVRRSVAETIERMVGTLTVTEAIDLLQAMSDDLDVDVREAVAGALAEWLERCDELWQIVIVEQWASSPMRLIRETLARAFTHRFESPIADLALELLAQDPVASVRLQVVEAIGSRLDEDPAGSGELLRQLSMDVKGKIRSQARRWLKRLDSPRVDIGRVIPHGATEFSLAHT